MSVTLIGDLKRSKDGTVDTLSEGHCAPEGFYQRNGVIKILDMVWKVREKGVDDGVLNGGVTS